MSLGLEHLVAFELIKLPAKDPRERKLNSMSRAFHYGGSFGCLKSFVRAGK